MGNRPYHRELVTPVEIVDKDSMEGFKEGVPEISRKFTVGIEMDLSESGQLGIYLKFPGMNVHGHAEMYTARTMNRMYSMVKDFAGLAAELVKEQHLLRDEKIKELEKKIESDVGTQIGYMMLDYLTVKPATGVAEK